MSAEREKISCIIGTKNAEVDISDCIESVIWTDEIIVIDDFSTDKTLEIARRYTNKIYQHPFQSYTQQKDFAVKKTCFRWVLSLDADERVSPQLKESILQKLNEGPQFDGYLCSRMNFFLGKQVKGCGWYEKNNLRFFNKERVSYNIGYYYLEEMNINGKIGRLTHDLLHYTCRELSGYLNRINIWSTLNAKDLINKGLRITYLNSSFYFFFKPGAIFFYKYFFKSGFRDGIVGLVICVLSVITYFFSYAKVWELQQRGRNPIA